MVSSESISQEKCGKQREHVVFQWQHPRKASFYRSDSTVLAGWFLAM